MPRTQFAPVRRRRSPIPFILLLLLVGLVALLVWLGLRDNEVPTQKIEQDVTNAVLAN
jgi:hypothetical protein